ncbi:asparagine synthase (glutamine-hydrolyzing) [Terrimonas alba]|uniref:asparagine synthase (glutamine-hydrolyzing) n=1 Tax=Terrimonas alba TaxID=3349636 RepID=UPI0035F2B63E
MCGIAGIINHQPGEENRSSLKQRLCSMTQSLEHRGPDGERIWTNSNGSAGLGHRRLAIIDLSEQASQPMHYDPADRYTIVHNGEIYNYPELRKELEQYGFTFRTQSDTEVILAAYAHWEDECVEHFDGMFSFAIWDEEEKELFAARDRFGEKPFFYHFANNEFCFSSEMKALWAAGVQRSVNLKMLFNFITIGYVDNPERPEETFYEKIFKLPPASRLYYSQVSGELSIEKYWDIDTEVENSSITDTQAIEQFTYLFIKSIKKRLRSDVAVGCSLSGGLDSSSIVAAISQLNTQAGPLNSFTAIFPGFEKDEQVFASQVASQFQLQQHQLEITADDLILNWDSFMHHQEEPVSSASAFIQYKVFELAKKQNIKVLLDGQGADEVLAGYHKYYKWYWQELFQRRRLIRSKEIPAARKIGVAEEFGFKNIMASLLPDLAAVILEKQYLFNALNHEHLHEDFIQLQSKEAYYTTPDLGTLNGILYFNTCIHGLQELLRYADRNSMAHGREIRLPFLSHELVTFIFSLPPNFKIRDGWTKWLLRQAMQQKLPHDIVWRKDKVGFEPPQKKWMQHKKIQDMIFDSRKILVKEKILSATALARPVRPSAAYEVNTDDWRYLTAGWLMQ